MGPTSPSDPPARRCYPLPPAALELYNIDDDPLEQNNLATAEAERASRMLRQMESWFEEVEAERRRIQPDGSIVELTDG